MVTVSPRALVACVALLVLAGCSERNQVGASASSERSAGVTQSSSYKQSESLSVNRERSATVTIPAAPVIFDALRIDLAAPPSAIPSELELVVRKQLAGRARAGTLAADEKAVWDAIRRRDGVRVRAIVTDALRPLVAWPVAPFDTHTGHLHHGAAQWAAERYAGTELANAVATQVAVRMAGQTVHDPAEARVKALAAFEQLDHAALLADFEARRRAAVVKTMDGNAVHYVLDSGADVKVDANGPAVALNGAPWFGAGTLSGKSYQFAMSKSVGDSSAESVDTSRERSAGASQRTDSSAATK